MDQSIVIVAIITGISGLLVSVLTHIRHSECAKCFKLDTRTPPQTPVEKKHDELKLQPKGGVIREVSV